MSWLVTGAGGLLGRHLVRRLGDERVAALDRRDLDITDADAVDAALARHRPRVVANCAAWTATDDAEKHPHAAWRVNVTGTRNLARACRRHGAVLLQLSSDYVFSGHARTPYREDAPTGPLNVYGRTKAAAESAVLDVLPDAGYVVRAAWLYGVGGRNFVDTMIGLERTHASVRVVDDQTGQPTWAEDLAGLLARLGAAALAGVAPPGVYHGTSGGAVTWHGLAQEVFRLVGADPARVLPVTSGEFGLAAARPGYSALGHDGWARAGIAPLRHWRDALHTAFPLLHQAHAQNHRAHAPKGSPRASVGN
ncbi:dTDP-4-dehydrorhamnose reductase [Streptomyces sp. A1499]|uniref:dTDP-4-dehydrorhamnose reductase n=1 Tax=Streptomyces sp. A1499 TaxID=2563104 RepID=UPI00109EC2FB|nr:dTDP-4-dehydrorhamnose reductase [Streptomyces sp. A1499]THC49381.1 dTDP-4-dehydrorhamnose reductase [Streptomyces sp. A1499]